jgi:hypothetical protein
MAAASSIKPLKTTYRRSITKPRKPGSLEWRSGRVRADGGEGGWTCADGETLSSRFCLSRQRFFIKGEEVMKRLFC